MTRSKRRLLLLFLSVPVIVVGIALLYQLGMEQLEERPRTFWQALEWSVETITTTGYGADFGWDSPAMVIFVGFVQFLGVFLVFLIVPIFLIPFLEERFEARLPRVAPGRLRDHVVVFRYGPAVATLLPQLEAAGVPTLVVEEDEAEARRVRDRGQRVIHALVEEHAMSRAGLDRARALVANGSDADNAAVMLAAKQRGFTGDLIGLVEEPSHRKPMMLAGAQAVYTPRHMLGAALAARASGRISPRVAGIQQLGRKLQVQEMRLQPGSPLAGQTLGEAGIGAHTGATVIGQWVGGELRTQPTAATRLEAGAVLVAVGGEENLARLTRLAQGAVNLRRTGPFLICGFGEVGAKVVQLLRDVGEEVMVLDRVARDGVDLVGDVLDSSLLEQAGVERAQAVVLALDSDSATLFATVILKELGPEVTVIARVNQAANVQRIHRAGADFALSTSQVASQILTHRLLGQEAVAIDPHLKVLRVPVAGLVGRRASELAIRQRTGCSVVAVERGDEALVDLGPDFVFAAEDAVYIAGSADAVARFSSTITA